MDPRLLRVNPSATARLPPWCHTRGRGRLRSCRLAPSEVWVGRICGKVWRKKGGWKKGGVLPEGSRT